MERPASQRPSTLATFACLCFLILSCAETVAGSADEDDGGALDAIADVATPDAPDASDVGDSDADDDAAPDAEADSTPDAEPDSPPDTAADAEPDTESDTADADPCPAGTEGCACDEGACADDLECIDDLCSEPECLPGEDGCACADEDFCEEALICADDECRPAESCTELDCQPLQLCELETARCLPACQVGFVWNASRNLCTPDGGGSCTPGETGSLAEDCQVERRECVLEGGRASCGDCLEGYFEVGDMCSPATCGDPSTDPFSLVRECGDQGRTCEEVDDGATCGVCLDGLLEDPIGSGCVEPTLCEDAGCGAFFRECDPGDGFARCAECLDGYVEIGGVAECVRFAECGELDCAARSRECLFDVTASCGGCLPGWIENDAGECECESTGGEPRQYWVDDDGDGFGDPDQLGACEDLEGYVANGDDCDDGDSAIHPDASDLPDRAYVDNNCDGTDGDIERLVFVHPSGDDETADGSLDAPFGTVNAAIGAAEFRDDADGVALVMGVHPGPVVMRDGVRVWGGWAAETPWTRSGDNVSTIRTSVAESGRLVGVVASDITSSTLLEAVAVETADGAPGVSTYGVAVFRSPGLILRDVRIRAGAGGAGAPGPNGGPGSNGTGGAGGRSGGDGGAGGAGGQNPFCPEAAGGRGGDGGFRNEYGGNGLPNGCGGAGGEDGRPWDNEGRPGGNGCSAAAPGAPGPDAPGAPRAGAVVDDWWVPEPGQRGPTGFPGSGGGGGGGGGGPEILGYDGGGGGGGGAGGCGGGGGEAGGGGGGAFGVWAVSSTGMSLSNANIAAGDGGAGGIGGSGGGPGAAGPGAGGGDGRGVSLSGSGRGGNGGNGSAGGLGGAGGGGGGGPSIGVRCIGTEVAPAGGSVVLAGSAGVAGPRAVAGGSHLTLGCDL